ncbi:uncharacterized protein [Montipora capricornis]|uniref:uncharacterized protein n=1 Tax=Montipora capricornis TaxID=246305 RepID=UPI0035F13647
MPRVFDFLRHLLVNPPSSQGVFPAGRMKSTMPRILQGRPGRMKELFIDNMKKAEPKARGNAHGTLRDCMRKRYELHDSRRIGHEKALCEGTHRQHLCQRGFCSAYILQTTMKTSIWKSTMPRILQDARGRMEELFIDNMKKAEPKARGNARGTLRDCMRKRYELHDSRRIGHEKALCEGTHRFTEFDE